MFSCYLCLGQQFGQPIFKVKVTLQKGGKSLSFYPVDTLFFVEGLQNKDYQSVQWAKEKLENPIICFHKSPKNWDARKICYSHPKI